ncbi:hypothetical protein HK096_000530, partial [Nowakowskiella sp. JEL0078]
MAFSNRSNEDSEELLGHQVVVRLRENDSLRGFLLNIDPITKSLFLLAFDFPDSEIEHPNLLNTRLLVAIGHCIVDQYSDSKRVLSEKERWETLNCMSVPADEINEDNSDPFVSWDRFVKDSVVFETEEEAKASLIQWLLA